MTSEKIREACKASPFRAFVLHLAGNRSLKVAHPEFVALSPSGGTAAIYGPDDTLEIVDVLMVQSIEFPGGAHGNGRRRKAG